MAVGGNKGEDTELTEKLQNLQRNRETKKMHNRF